MKYLKKLYCYVLYGLCPFKITRLFCCLNFYQQFIRCFSGIDVFHDWPMSNKHWLCAVLMKFKLVKGLWKSLLLTTNTLVCLWYWSLLIQKLATNFTPFLMNVLDKMLFILVLWCQAAYLGYLSFQLKDNVLVI